MVVVVDMSSLYNNPN